MNVQKELLDAQTMQHVPTTMDTTHVTALKGSLEMDSFVLVSGGFWRLKAAELQNIKVIKYFSGRKLSLILNSIRKAIIAHLYLKLNINLNIMVDVIYAHPCALCSEHNTNNYK